VAGTAAGGPGNALLEAIVSMAQRMRLDVIQEGIEKRDQLYRLRAMGCRLGHLLSPAVSADLIEAMLTAPTPFPHIDLCQPDNPARLTRPTGRYD